MNNPRRFSLDRDFMDYDTDDLIYGFMRSISTAKPTDNNKYEEYLTVKKFKQEKRLLQGICGASAQTINNRIKKLIDKGLVEEGEITVEKNDKKYTYPCYYFPYDYEGIYKIIEQEMVSYLVSTRNAHAIRIYLYLLNCQSYKKDYVFTIGEIKKALGYAESTKSADKAIGYVLESFNKEGLIKYTKELFECIDDYGKTNKTERMVLKYVKTSTKEF